MKYHLVYRKGRYYPVLGDIDAGNESIDQGVTDRTQQPAEVYLEVPRFPETANLVESNTRNSFSSPTQSDKQFRPCSAQLYNETLRSKFSTPSLYCNVFEERKDTETKFKLPISEQYDPEGKKIKWFQVEKRIIKRIRQMKDDEDIAGSKIRVKNSQPSTSRAYNTKNIENVVNNVTDEVHFAANDVVTDSIEKAVLVAEEIIKEIDGELKEKRTSTPKPSEIFMENKKVIKANEKNSVEETSDPPPSVRESVLNYETIDEKTVINTNQDKLENDRKLFLIQEIKESIEAGSVKRKSSLFEKKSNEFIDEKRNVKRSIISKDSTQKSIEYDLKILAQKRAYLTGLQMITNIKNLSGSSHRCKTLLKIFLLYLTDVMIAFSRFFPKLVLHSNTYQTKKEKTDIKDIISSYTSNSELCDEDNLIINENKYHERRKLSGSEIAQIVSRIPVELTQKMDTVISEFHTKLNIKDVKHSRSKSCSRIEEVNKNINPFKWLSVMSTEERERVKKEIKLATLEAARRILDNRRRTSFQSYDNAAEFECNIPLNKLMYIAIVESHVYTNKNAIFDDYISKSKPETVISREVTDYSKAEAVKTEFSGTYNMINKSRKKSDIKDYKAYENEEISEYLDVYATNSTEKSEINKNTLLRTDYVATVTVEHKQVPREINLQKDDMSVYINEQTEEETVTSTIEKIDDIIQKDEEYIIPAIQENEFVTAQVLGHSIVSDVCTNFVTVKEDTINNLSVKEHTVIPVIEKKEFTKVQAVNTATARQTAEVEDITIIDSVTNIETKPTVSVEIQELNTAKVYGKETLRQHDEVLKQVDIKDYESYEHIENKAVHNVETEYTTAEIINNAIHRDIDTVFCQVDSNLVTSEEINIQVATTKVEIQELEEVESVCYATHLNIDYEEAVCFENKLRIEIEHITPSAETFKEKEVQIVNNATVQDVTTTIEETVDLKTNKIEEQLVNITKELSELSIVIAICTPSNNDMAILFNEVENFELNQNQEEKANIKIEDDKFCKAQSICTATYHDLIILMEKVATINIDKVTNESAVINEVPREAKVLVMATPSLSHFNFNFDETIVINIESIKNETATSEEETKQFISAPASGIILYIIEECDILKIEKNEEELTEPCLEPNIFSIALAIGTSYLEEIKIIYVQTQSFVAADIKIEHAEISEIENIFVTALAICIAIIIATDIALEESKVFVVDEVQVQSTSEILEPQVLTSALPVSTPIYKQISIILNEIQVLVIEDFPKELALPSEEDEVFVKALITCNDVSSVINIELKECVLFEHDQVPEEFAEICTEPHVFATVFAFCTSVYKEIIMNYDEANTLELDIIKDEKLEITEERNVLVSTIATCVAINKIMNIDLEETGSFTPEIIKTESLPLIEESQILTSTLPSGVASMREIIISYSIAESLIIEDLQEEKAVLNVEEKYLSITIPYCVDVIRTSRIQLEEVKCYDVEKIKEETAFTSLEPQIYFKSTPLCVATTISLNIPTFEVTYKETEFVHNETASLLIEMRDFERTQAMCEATAKYVHEVFTEAKINSIAYNVANHYADIILESEHLESASSICLVKHLTFNFDSVEKSEGIRFTNEKSNLSIETEEFKTAHAMRKSTTEVTNLRSVDNNVSIYSTAESKNISNIEADNIVVVKTKQSQNLREKQSKEVFREENDLNVIVRKKEKAVAAQAYQELSTELSLSKVKHESISETIEDTLVLGRKRDVKELHVSEEIHDRSKGIEIESLEEESGVVIEDITDEESNTIQTVNYAEDIANARKRSQDINIKTIQIHNLSEGFEEMKNLKVNKTPKELKASTDESAALTITKKEELEIIQPVLQLEEEDLTVTNITNIKEISGDIECTINSGSSQSFEIYEGSVQRRTNTESNKQSSASRTIKRSTLRNINTPQEEVVNGYNELESSSFTSKFISASVQEKSLAKTSLSFDSTTSAELTASFSNVSNPAIMSTESSNKVIKSGYITEQILDGQTVKNGESIIEVQSPTTPPTPLTDEYIFRLTAPLPKSRSTTPIPRDPSPENLQSSLDDDSHIVNKNLVPSIETVICERVLYNPPLPTPPTSPVYNKPGLNGGERRLPRFIKPGLRGGSDRPPITKDEVLEVLKYTSRLTSAITETLKNIEEYKKEVGILKQAAYDCKNIMDTDETNNNYSEEQKNTKTTETQDNLQERSELSNITEEETFVEPSVVEEDIMIKENLKENNVERKDGDKNEKDTVIIEECDTTIDVAENVDDIEKDSIKVTVEPPSEIVKVKAEGVVPNREEIIEEVDEINDEGVIKERIIDTDDVAADLEVASEYELNNEVERRETISSSDGVIEGSAMDDEVIERNQATTFKEVEMIKEAHVMSLTRVLSAHMLREELSPDCQKMKTQYESQLTGGDGMETNGEGKEDRSWTTFMQKTHLGPGQELEHFAVLKKKFERSAFNSSPVPWQKASDNSLGAPSALHVEDPQLISGEEPAFFVAIPLESTTSGLATIIPLPSSVQRDVTKFEVMEEGVKEMGRVLEDSVDEIVKEALKVAEKDIGVEEELLEHVMSDVIESKEGLVKSQLEQQVSDVNRKIVDGDQFGADQNTDEVVTVSKSTEYIEQNTAPKPAAVKLTTDNTEQAQSIKEIEKAAADKMPAETRGGLKVIEGPDKYKKVVLDKIWPGPSVCKKYRESNCHLVDFHNVQENVVPSYNKLIENKLYEVRKASDNPRPLAAVRGVQARPQHGAGAAEAC